MDFSRFSPSAKTRHPNLRPGHSIQHLSFRDALVEMETVTIYAAAAPTSPSIVQPATEPTAGDPPQLTMSAPAAAQNSASQPSSSQSSNIALWVPIGIVILLVVIGLLSWATKSQRAELNFRARDPDAPIAVRRDRKTWERELASRGDLQGQNRD